MPPRFSASVLAALILFILAIQVIAISRDLYFYIWWLDILMHALGGLWIALFVLSTYYGTSYVKEKKHSPMFAILFALSISFAIGLSWEIYELSVDRVVGGPGGLFGGPADTFYDIANDCLGALLGALIFIKGGYNKNMNSFLRPSLGGENDDVSTSLTRLENKQI